MEAGVNLKETFHEVASTTAAEKRLVPWRQPVSLLRTGLTGSLRPKLGVRARQIVLITFFVSVVVMATTLADIVHLTSVIVRSTDDRAERFSDEIIYAIRQEEPGLNQVTNPYDTVASQNSAVRSVMESTIASLGPISYVFLTDAAGHRITDASGENELTVNEYMIVSDAPDLSELTGGGAFHQLRALFLGQRIYELRQDLPSDGPILGAVHIGVSARVVRGEMKGPIETDLLIFLAAIAGAAIAGFVSADLLLKPLAAITSSIDRLSSGEDQPVLTTGSSRDDVVSGVTARLRQLGERMAGDRSELEIMRGRLRQVISHLEERLLLINRDGRVILASPEAESLLGAKQTELAGLPIDESLGPNHPLVRIVERALSERRSITRITLDVPRGGDTLQLLASVQYIEDGGEPVGALVSLRDYESFQKLESQWDLSKKLADLGRITSGIAHEVKNPLNAMVIHLEILRSKLESGSGNPTPQIEILDSEIKRLDRVVQTFLNFTRPVEARLDPIDMNNLIHQVTLLANTEAQEMGVTITENLSYSPLFVKGDADLLKQALLNVIINGCQAMPDGGPLKITTSAGRDDSNAHITVTDRGIGISPEARDRIFNLYYTTKKGGTGIGLAQAFRAIQMHNGMIRFETEAGIGTVFEIILPLSPQS
ncbi:MAG TPA: ATP-binding protein [Blastocatellia bacterium]